jgi:hypothetical protein
VVDEQLRAAVEQPGQSLCPGVGLEVVGLLERDPGQLEPLAGELVAATRQFLLAGEQLEPCGPPLLAGAGSVRCGLGHRFLLVIELRDRIIYS